MSIEFRCRNCNRLLRTDDGTAGQTARCPDCSSLTVIPAPDAPPASSYGRGPPGPAPSGQEWHVPPSGSMPDGTGETNPYQTPTQFGTPGYGLQTERDGRATASLVLGLVGLILWCCPFVGIINCGVGLTLGILSLKANTRGMAVGGIILNAIGLLLALMNAALGAVLAVLG